MKIWFLDLSILNFINYSLVIFPFDHYFYEIPYCLSITKLSFSCWFIVSGWFHLVKFYLLSLKLYFATVQFSRSVVSDSLWSHGLHHARLPSPSVTPGACSNSCPLGRWCHRVSESITGITLQFMGLSKVCSISTVWKHQFFSNQPSLGANSHICIWLLEK